MLKLHVTNRDSATQHAAAMPDIQRWARQSGFQPISCLPHLLDENEADG